MSRVLCHMSIALDGFIAGPDQSLEQAYGVGGRELHEWHKHADEPGHEADRALRDSLMRVVGAHIIGRNMFGPVRGEWTGDWRGWWGDDPPFHTSVFVLTHHPRETVVMEGGTRFIFVTDGFEAALEQATDVAAGADVRISGGASTVRQAFALGVIDELQLSIVPLLLGSGERIFEGVGENRFEPVETVHSPFATHVRYLVRRPRQPD